MTFSFYHSLVSQPTELDEAARIYRLTKWQRFWKLDVPSSMIGLVWNAMMSMGGGWFFLAASEAITISGKGTTYLPGIGSYVGTAINQGSLSKVGIAIAVMVVMVIGVNVLVFRPLVAWAEKFRMEDSDVADKPRSVVLGFLLRQSHPRHAPDPRAGGPGTGPDHPPLRVGRVPARRRPAPPAAGRRRGVLGRRHRVRGMGIGGGLIYLFRKVGVHAFVYTAGLGSVTFVRVVVVVIVSTLVWVPVGVKIGMSPRLARYAQPVVQILASFPSILLFPFAVIAFLAIDLPLNFGSDPHGHRRPVVHPVQHHRRGHRHPQ